MQTFLISKDLDNLLFLDVLNEDFREQSKLISILISSLIQQSPLLSIYEEKKKLLLDTLNSQRENVEKNLFRNKLVNGIFNFKKVWNFKNLIFPSQNSFIQFIILYYYSAYLKINFIEKIYKLGYKIYKKIQCSFRFWNVNVIF